MTIEQFGQQIKAKYPQYQTLSDAEIGQKMLTKYPQYQSLIKEDAPKQVTDTFLEGHPVLKGISDFIGTTGLGRGIAQGIFLRYTTEGKNLMQQVRDGKIKYDDLVNITGAPATNKEIVSSAAQTGLTFAALGQSPLTSGKTIVNQGAKTFLKSAGTQALKTGGLVGAGSAIGEYGKGGSPEEILKAGATGAAIGGAFSAAGSVAKLGISKIPKLLGYTSEVPPGVLDRSAAHPDEMSLAQDQVKKLKPEGVLDRTQGAVRQLRKDLSASYKEGRDVLANQFGDTRVGLNTREEGMLNKVIDEFGTIEPPQDIKNLSLQEGLDLYKQVNELYGKGMVSKSPEGIIVRNLRETLRGKLISTFGGEQGALDMFLKNYSAEKGVHDAMDILVKAYKTGDPKAETTALNTLYKVFDENKPAYLQAVKDFEAKTGVNVLDQIGSLQTQKLLPSKTGKSGLDQLQEIFKTILFPLYSPRAVGVESRVAGRISESGAGTAATLVKGALKVGASKLGSEE